MVGSAAAYDKSDGDLGRKSPKATNFLLLLMYGILPKSFQMKHVVLYGALLMLAGTACVSKKKHLAAVASYERAVDSLGAELDSTVNLVGALRLDTAERRGENTALLLSQDQLMDRIIALDDEIERLEQEAASLAEDQDELLQQKEAKIVELDQRIAALQGVLKGREAALANLAAPLRDSLLMLDSTAFTVEGKGGQLSLSILSDYVFKPGSTRSMTDKGQLALEKAVQLLLPYTSLEVVVIGHTNTEPLRRRSIDNKWEFTAMRAATLAAYLTRELELNTSRVMAAGKGDFAPRTSNDTAEGRRLNDRLELRIQPSEERLLRDLRRKLDE